MCVIGAQKLNIIELMDKVTTDAVFCCIARRPESSLTFLVVNKIFLLSEVENILGYIREHEKIFEIVQENTLKCSKLIHF